MTEPSRPLRLWPGVVIVALQWLGRYVFPMFDAELLPMGALAGLAALRPAHFLRRTARRQVFAHDFGPLRNELAMGEPVALKRRAGDLPEMLVETVHACQL